MFLSEPALCKSISVEILGNSENQIIDAEDIKRLVIKNNKNIIGSSISSINLSELENKIEEYPAVKNAEVFTKINGILGIKLEQRIPIVRVASNFGDDFYIGSEGALMPTSDTGSARVIVASGHIKFKYKKNKISINDTTITGRLKGVYAISKALKEDAFLTAQTAQIYVKRTGEYELVPTVGNHIVLIGKLHNYNEKLKFLKHFFFNFLKNEGWRKYKYINLKFKNQIVCTQFDKE